MGQDDEDDHQHADGCCSHDHEHAHGHDPHANGKEQHHSSGLDAASTQAKSDSSIIDDDSDSSEDEEGGTADLVYPAAYAPALAELLSSYSDPVRVKDIRLPNVELQLDLAVSLWREGIVCTLQSSAATPANKRRR